MPMPFNNRIFFCTNVFHFNLLAGSSYISQAKQAQNTEKKTCDMSTEVRRGESDQSLRCPHEESLGPWAHSEDSDQTGRMPRLIWVFAGRPLILLVLSCRGSYRLLIKSRWWSLQILTSCSVFNLLQYCLSVWINSGNKNIQIKAIPHHSTSTKYSLKTIILLQFRVKEKWAQHLNIIHYKVQ